MESILRYKKSTALFFLWILVFSANIGHSQYTTQGQNFINQITGEKVILRGFGLGCWLLPEGYMWGIRKLDRPWQFERAIEDLIGEKDAEQFWRLYHDNFLTEQDIAAMKSWGANSLRIALLASLLQPRNGQPDSPPYHYSEYGFGLLDKLVSWCAKYDIGIIWDMHGAPGAQNAENISDSDGETRLWTEKEKYWPMCMELWFKIAERYKDSKNIIGYDLLNEPLLIRYDKIDPKLLRELYVHLTDTIRTIDPDGIIFIEGDDWAQTFEILEPMDWDPHLAIAFHSYPPTSNQEGLERWDKLGKKYNIPLWHGETGEQWPPYQLNLKATSFLDSVNVSWSWWTHKKFDMESQPWSCVRNPGFLKILDYWKGSREKPSKAKCKKWLFEQAKKTHSDYCEFLPDMVRSLVPLNPDEYIKSRKIIKPEIVIQPENMSTEEGGMAQAVVRSRGFPLNYQWYKDGHILNGEIGKQLYISNPSLKENNATFFIRISNSEGIIESEKIQLDVHPFTGLSIHKTAAKPIIDAYLDDIWKQAQPVILGNLRYGTIDSESDFSVWVKLLWDDDCLYIWAQITDDITGAHKNARDALDIYLDPANHKNRVYGDDEYILHYPRNGTDVEVTQGSLNRKIDAAQKEIENGYKMELAIPWMAVHGAPEIGNYVGIEIQAVDNDNERRSAILLLNGKTGFAHRSPMYLGTMKLVEK